MKCVMKGIRDADVYGLEKENFETLYNGIPEACAMWAAGMKHGFLSKVSLYYFDTGLEVPIDIKKEYFDRYYHGEYKFDEFGEELMGDA